MNKEQYKAYLQSEAWKERRKLCLEHYEYRCQVCGCTSWRRVVDVHHLHYKNVGSESNTDLVPLCCVHHAMIHNQSDGYNLNVLQRLRRECEEGYWSDPLPGHARDSRLNDGGNQTRFLLCGQCYSRQEVANGDPFCTFCNSRIVTQTPGYSMSDIGWTRLSEMLEHAARA